MGRSEEIQQLRKLWAEHKRAPSSPCLDRQVSRVAAETVRVGRARQLARVAAMAPEGWHDDIDGIMLTKVQSVT